MTQSVLITYGDGYGPSVIRSAETILKTVAPELTIYHGKIGADAYNNTTYALPPETLDLVSEVDAILSGPTDMRGINERDPLAVIKKQMGLYLEYREFLSLSDRLGYGDVDLVIMSPTVESSLNVYETESLDGVASEYYTSVDNIADIYSKTLRVAQAKGLDTIHLVSDNTLYPIRERLIRNEFHKSFDNGDIVAKDLSTAEALFYLTRGGSNLGAILCDIHSATCACGQADGMVGGGGLMPRAFLGDGKALYMSSVPYPGDVANRAQNPTSAILSVAVMMYNFGKRDAYKLIVDSVKEMYQLGRVTPDVGGKLSPEKYTDSLKKLIISEMSS